MLMEIDSIGSKFFSGDEKINNILFKNRRNFGM